MNESGHIAGNKYEMASYPTASILYEASTLRNITSATRAAGRQACVI